jgi:hypothetical protein
VDGTYVWTRYLYTINPSIDGLLAATKGVDQDVNAEKTE